MRHLWRCLIPAGGGTHTSDEEVVNQGHALLSGFGWREIYACDFSCNLGSSPVWDGTAVTFDSTFKKHKSATRLPA
jgi:hypothetical protein